MRQTSLLSTAALLVVSGSAMAQVYNNGPFVTGIGNGLGGRNTSAIDPTHNAFGSGTNANNPGGASGGPIRVADDFTVTGPGWDISSATFYLYQTITSPAVNPLANTITSIRVGVYTSLPTAATPDFGDFTTNRQTSAVFSNVFRVTSTTLTNDDRAIMAVTVDMTWLQDLTPGTYWLAWSTTGSTASGPWAVPVTPAASGHNARQFLDATGTGAPGTWNQIDGNAGTGSLPGIQPLDLAFQLNYTEVPTPGAVAVAGLAGLAGLRRRRA